MVSELVRDAVDSLVRRGVVPEAYRAELEESVDLEMRRKARLLGTTLARKAMNNVAAKRLLGASA